VFFQACGTLRGMNAQVPGPPTATWSPILKVNCPKSIADHITYARRVYVM
jgi:hypothetical protein